MNLMDLVKMRADEFLERHLQEPSHSPSPRDLSSQGGPRSLTPEDIDDFEAAAQSRSTVKERNLEKFIEMLSVLDYFRYRRLRKDMNWVRKHAADMGIPPHAVPWEKIQ